MDRACFFLLFSISLFSRAMAQERSPHGLYNQKPVAFSPSAYEFFHPNGRQDPCAMSNCSPLPIAARLHETQSGAGSMAEVNVRKAGVGVGAIVVPAFVVLIMFGLMMGIYYLATTRRAKLSLTKSLAPDV